MRFARLTSKQRFLLRPWMPVMSTIVFFGAAAIPFVCFSADVATAVGAALTAITFPLALKAVVEI